jgi:hypothetical protein
MSNANHRCPPSRQPPLGSLDAVGEDDAGDTLRAPDVGAATLCAEIQPPLQGDERARSARAGSPSPHRTPPYARDRRGDGSCRSFVGPSRRANEQGSETNPLFAVLSQTLSQLIEIECLLEFARWCLKSSARTTTTLASGVYVPLDFATDIAARNAMPPLDVFATSFVARKPPASGSPHHLVDSQLRGPRRRR